MKRRGGELAPVSAVAALLFAWPATCAAGLFPDMTIGYQWNGVTIEDGKTFDLRTGLPAAPSTYTWGGGSANGLLYRGEFQKGAVRLDGHFLGSSGSKVEFSDFFPGDGEYFIVIHQVPWWADSFWRTATNEWFKNGTTLMPSAHPPESWGIIRFTVGDVLQPPAITGLGQFRKFGEMPVADGATFVGNEAVFKAQVSDADSTVVKLEVEVKPSTQAFDDTGIYQSDLVAAGELSVAVEELIPVAQHYVSGGNEGEFHWRARAVDGEGHASEWVEYGGSSGADFAVKVVPLWTQVASAYPSDAETQDWAAEDYASGYDPECSSDDPSNATIAKCGCAVTSAVMIAHYFGVENGIDGSPITPQSLNAWLNANEGYVGLNNVSWTKVEEYFGTTINDEPNARLALDRANFKTRSRDVIDTYLDDENPVIAFNEKYGHYIVLDSQAASSYTLRDPLWYNTRTLNDAKNIANDVQDYNDTFGHGTIFTKLDTPRRIAARTELFLASPAEILVTDGQGRRVGKDPRTNEVYQEIPNATYVLEDRIASSEEEMAPEDVPHPVKALYLPDVVGTYTIEIIGTGTGEYTLTSVMTDDQGNSARAIFTDTTVPHDVTTYQLETDGGLQTMLSVPEIWESLWEITAALTGGTQKGVVARLRVIEKHIAEGRIDVAREQITGILADVTEFEATGKITVVTAERLRALLVMLRNQI